MITYHKANKKEEKTISCDIYSTDLKDNSNGISSISQDYKTLEEKDKS